MTPEQFASIRRELGLSSAGLAAALSSPYDPMSQATIWRYENGERSVPAPVAHLMLLMQRYHFVRRFLKIPELQRRYPLDLVGRPKP